MNSSSPGLPAAAFEVDTTTVPARPAIFTRSALDAQRRCPRRLWLMHAEGDLRHVAGHSGSARTQDDFERHARSLLDPSGEACAQAQAAGLGCAPDEVLLPLDTGTGGASGTWSLHLLRAAASVKPNHPEELALRWASRDIHPALAGAIQRVHVVIVNTGWTWMGGDDWTDSVQVHDLTDAARAQLPAARSAASQAVALCAQPLMPSASLGRHCLRPGPCPFLSRCDPAQQLDTRPAARPASRSSPCDGSGQAPHTVPVNWLPQPHSRALRQWIEQHRPRDMRAIPPPLLNPLQMRVRECSITNTVWHDTDGALQRLNQGQLPAAFLDFEAVQFAVPPWPGTRPFEQLPVQFSLHVWQPDGSMQAHDFLQIDRHDPHPALTLALLDACRGEFPLYVFNTDLERICLAVLARRLPQHADALQALGKRLVDIEPVVRDCWYHPGQQGSFSLKRILPTVGGGPDHDDLDGVHDGGMAVDAWLEAIEPGTSETRRAQLAAQLRHYCALDTAGLARLWGRLVGREPSA